MKLLYRFFAIAIVLMLITIPAFGDSGTDLPIDPQTSTIGAVSNPRTIPGRDDADEVVFLEDWEDGADDWVTEDKSVLAWHTSDFNERDEEGLAWWCGDTLTDYDGDPVGYDNIWLQYLDTEVLDLSGAGDGLALTFDGWWLIEDPRIVPPADPYDAWDGFIVMISEDGGEEFAPLMPTEPEYQAERVSAAERVWGLEGEWPGWTFHSGEWEDTNRVDRPDVEWVACSFDLSEFRSEEIVIRWALISDRAVAAPYDNLYLQESGVLIDNIQIIDDDEEIYLFNTAEGGDDDDVLMPTLPAGFGGDNWELTDGEGRQHEGQWSMWHDDDWFMSNNWLTSPPIELPEEFNLHFQWWVWCDMPDSDSDGDNALEDFFQVYLSDDDGETWQYQCHDYNRPEAGGDEWTHYVPGTPFGGTANVDLDITDWAGQTILLQWRFRSDADHGPNGNLDGEGLFIDDIEVIGDNRQSRDVGMTNIHLPYPTTVDFRTTNFTVECWNYGLRNIAQITSRWTWTDGENGRTLPITPRPSLDPDEFITLGVTDYRTREAGWTPTVPGVFDVGARTTLGMGTGDEDDDDQAPENDSTGVPDVRVWPADLYELGYDNRTYQYLFNFDQGTGVATKFTPEDHGFDEYSLAWAHFRFNDAQDETATFRLHVLGEGIENTPGEDIFELEVEVPVDSLLPNHMTVPLFEYDALRGLEGEFWIWAEVMRDDNWPQIIGDDQLRGEDRYFSYDGQNTAAFDQDILMHATIVPGSEVVADLAPSTYRVEFGEVRVDESAAKSFTLYASGLSAVTITDVSANTDVFTVDWPGEITLAPGKTVSFDIIYEPPDGEVHLGALTIESDDEDPPEVDLIGIGMLGAGDESAELPRSFGLAEPYPNPFNARTIVHFNTDLTGEVSLRLYDLKGRLLVTLAEGVMQAGAHQTVLNGESMPAGIYMLKLKSGNRQAVRKVALIK